MGRDQLFEIRRQNGLVRTGFQSADGAGLAMTDLYTAATPNSWKVTIAREEMELAYTPHVLNLRERNQHEE